MPLQVAAHRETTRCVFAHAHFHQPCMAPHLYVRLYVMARSDALRCITVVAIACPETRPAVPKPALKGVPVV